VPLADRAAIFHAIHSMAYPGIHAIKPMVTAHFIVEGCWQGHGIHVPRLQQCERGKVHKQPAAPVNTIPVPARKYSHMHVDLVSPLPASSEGHL
jgi:hypothetical protein